jgi:hypothetical protein
MIISASRRTDIPAFYPDWLMNRVRAGFCTVPNPFNRRQVSTVSLTPADVDAFVFWTRNPQPLVPHLDELDARGYHYYFQFTILGYPRELDPKSPSVAAAVQSFQRLAERLGPARVIWRYDPIVITSRTSVDFHRANYERLARLLRQYTLRSVISLVDLYRKAVPRLNKLEGTEVAFLPLEPSAVAGLLTDLAACATANGMDIVSCAEELDFLPNAIRPGKCVDDGLLAILVGHDVTQRKDPSQRAACGCVASRDIGMYDSCLFGCQYCYATQSFERARRNYDKHDPQASSLLN